MSKPTEAKCPRCGATLPPSAPEGLCPRCLGALNLATDTVLTGADAIAAQPPLTPAELAPHFPQLEIIECLGRGGMGVVYRVRQKALNRLAALKLLAPERVTDAGFAERFTREAQALARLNHPNIVTIYDFGATTPLQTPDAIPHPPFYFLLMEFMDGVNLRQAMRTERFTPEQALAIVPPVCEALQYAHEHGIVHRDIKPENLLLDKAGRPKIADFGIAKILEPGRAELPTGQREEAEQQHGPTAQESFTAGTPGYMAPEQKSAPQRVDSRADIYSLGVVIYEMLTGELPAEKLQPPSRKVQIDVRLDEIVLRALEQKPELRFQTAADLRTQVETFGREDREERIEKSKQPPPPSSILSPLSSPPPPPPRPFLKTGTSTLTTPAELATVSGQFFCFRTRGQLILDDRQLTHSCAGTNTVIPLAAIRDLSIGRYPRTMNPAGIDFLSVTYEDGGQRKQVLLSPMKGWFSEPTSFNAHITEWHAALREAVRAATGQTPASSPVQAIGAPFNSFAPVLALAAAPILVGVGLMMFIRRHDGAGGFAGALGLFEAAVFATCFFAVLLLNWFLAGRLQRAGRWLVLTPVLLLLGFLSVWFLVQVQSPAGVTRFDSVPVGVSNNVVIVDVTTEVGRGNAELRAMLDGPQLPAATEAALADAFFPPFAGTFIKPTTHAGNHPWRILSAGGLQTWRLGFVLPDAALARDAMESLHPVGPLPAVPDRTYAGTLFEVRQTNGQVFHASLHVALPFTSADTNWVSVSTMATYNESIVTMNWEVLASQPGTARCQREGNRSTAQLQLDAKSKLYRVPVRLELTKVSTNRVLLVTEAGGSKSREELTGSFRELSAELVRFINLSAKTVRGAEIELCQFQGKPFTVQVDALPPPMTTAVPTKVVRWGFSGMPLWPVVAAVVLTVVIGGLVLLVVLARKGGAGGKLALLLVGAAGLFVAVALAALFVWRGLTIGDMPMTDSIPILVAGVVALSIVGGGIALLVMLVRKGGSASKIPPSSVPLAVMALAFVPLALLSLKYVTTRQQEKQWHSVPMAWTNSTNSIGAVLRFIEVTREGRIVFFRIFSEPGLSPVNFLVSYDGSALQPVPPVDAVTNVAALFAPTLGGPGGYPGQTLRGTNLVRGPGEFTLGFVLPDEARAAMAVQQARELYPPEQPCWVGKPGVLVLFAQIRKAGEKDREGLQAMLHVNSATGQLQVAPAANETPAPTATIPQHIEFKVLRVENPPGTRDILLHFERDTNYGLTLEVSQVVTPSPGLRKQPQPGHRTWQQTTWVGVHDRVLGWTLPQEFTAAEVRAVVKEMEQRTKTMRQLPDGAVPEFATAIHRDGWKYHLVARVKREPGTANSPPHQSGAPASSLHP